MATGHRRDRSVARGPGDNDVRRMGALSKISTGQLAVVVGVVTALAWILIRGTVAPVISIVGGGLIALSATADSDSAGSPDVDTPDS